MTHNLVPFLPSSLQFIGIKGRNKSRRRKSKPKANILTYAKTEIKSSLGSISLVMLLHML